MAKGTFAVLADALQEAADAHNACDHAVLMLTKTTDQDATARAERAMKEAGEKRDRLESALVVTAPDTAIDALRLVAVAASCAQIIGDCLGDDSPAETEWRNLTAALEGLTAHLFNAVPKAQRKPAVLGFSSYLYGVGLRHFPADCELAERSRDGKAKAAAADMVAAIPVTPAN